MSRHLVTLKEAARELSVPIGTLYSWASRRRITVASVGTGGQKFYRRDEIAALAEETRRRNAGHA